MLAIIQIRRDTASNWETANPVLSQGEIGIVLATNPTEFRVGDGLTHWNLLQVQTLLTEQVKAQIIAGLSSTVAQLQEQLSNEISVRTEQVAALTAALADKVDKGSWDPTLHAGLADNLYDSNEGNADTAHVAFRSTGGETSLSTGPAEFKSFKGMTIRQLAKNPDSPASQTIQTISGHVYYIEVLAKHSSVNVGRFGLNDINLAYTNRWCFKGIRVSATSNQTVLTLETAASFKYCNVVDLTEHQLEATLSTAVLCNDYFAHRSKPYGLSSVNLTALHSVSFNQFDASTMVYAKTMAANGTVTDSTTHSLICMPCIKGETGSGKNNGYRIHSKTGSIIRVGYSPIAISDEDFDKGYDVVSPASSVADYDFVPSDYGFLIAVIKTEDVLSTIIHLKWSYSDFSAFYASSPNYSMSALPITVADTNAIGNVYDEAFLKSRVITRKIQVQKLTGVENWTYVPPTVDDSDVVTKNGYFYTTFAGAAGQLLCDKYTNMTSAIIALEDKCIRVTGSQLQIVDTAYTSVPDFVASLVEANVTILYPGTESVDTIVDTQNYTYTADDFGVERIIPSNGVLPATVTFVYLSNLKDKLRNIPEDAVSASGEELQVVSQALASIFGSLDALDFRTFKALEVFALNLLNYPTLGNVPWFKEGDGAPTVAPDFPFQFYRDITNKVVYIAVDVASSASFKAITS